MLAKSCRINFAVGGGHGAACTNGFGSEARFQYGAIRLYLGSNFTLSLHNLYRHTRRQQFCFVRIQSFSIREAGALARGVDIG